jgi:hypothetical protein
MSAPPFCAFHPRKQLGSVTTNYDKILMKIKGTKSRVIPLKPVSQTPGSGGESHGWVGFLHLVSPAALPGGDD